MRETIKAYNFTLTNREMTAEREARIAAREERNETEA